jgi:cysteine desulfuration protein SufE
MSGQDLDAAIRDIEDEFALFSDWEERYAHVIDLGRAAPPLSDQEKTEANRIRGCASQVWLVTAFDPATGRLKFRGDSDAFLVRGLVALMVGLASDRTPADVLKLDARALMARLGLDEALTPQRSNGLAALVARMRAEAEAARA